MWQFIPHWFRSDWVMVAGSCMNRRGSESTCRAHKGRGTIPINIYTQYNPKSKLPFVTYHCQRIAWKEGAAQRCCESSPCRTTGLWPAVYKSNYTLLATHLPAKLAVLVCLAPGDSFHLYEMSVVEDGASLTHLSSPRMSMSTGLYVDVYVFHNIAGFPIKDHSASRKTQLESTWGPAAANICFQRAEEGCRAVFSQDIHPWTAESARDGPSESNNTKKIQ